MNEITSALKGLRDLFFPRQCNVCGSILDIDESGLCRKCFSDLPLTYFWDWPDNPSYRKLSDNVLLKSAVALYYFRPDAGYNGIMHSIKYQGNKQLGYRLGWLLGDYLTKSDLPKPDAVVPVPLHPLRYFKRGYNQAAVIAEGISSALGVETHHKLLRRTRHTRSQVSLSTEKKRDNIKGAFKANQKEIKKMTNKGVRHILIVDDTMTTGATLAECCKAVSDHFEVSTAALAYCD